jgi:hypothetical protein
VFNRKLIDELFSAYRDQLVATPDSKYVLYRFDRGSKFEFRLETQYITLERFYLNKNVEAKTKLIKLISDMGKFEGEVL